MKLSTPQTPKPRDPLAILLIGPPGGGKSTLMLQFPDLLVLDCNNNLDGPERFLRHGNPPSAPGAKPTPGLLPTLAYAVEDVNYSTAADGTRTEVALDKRFERLLGILQQISQEPSKYAQFKTIAVDDLTTVNEYIKFRIYREQKRDYMETRDWDRYKGNLWALILRSLRSSGKDTILTCHENILTKTNKENFMVEEVIGYRPTVQGGIADTFAGQFTDAWRVTSNLAPGGKVEITMETTKQGLSPHLKNSVGFPPVIKEVTYAKLAPYLPKR